MCMYHAGNRGNQTRAYTYDVSEVSQGQKSREGAAGRDDALGGPRGNGRKRPLGRRSGDGRGQGAQQTGISRVMRRGRSN